MPQVPFMGWCIARDATGEAAAIKMAICAVSASLSRSGDMKTCGFHNGHPAPAYYWTHIS